MRYDEDYDMTNYYQGRQAANRANSTNRCTYLAMVSSARQSMSNILSQNPECYQVPRVEPLTSPCIMIELISM